MSILSYASLSSDPDPRSRSVGGDLFVDRPVCPPGEVTGKGVFSSSLIPTGKTGSFSDTFAPSVRERLPRAFRVLQEERPATVARRTSRAGETRDTTVIHPAGIPFVRRHKRRRGIHRTHPGGGRPGRSCPYHVTCRSPPSLCPLPGMEPIPSFPDSG